MSRPADTHRNPGYSYIGDRLAEDALVNHVSQKPAQERTMSDELVTIGNYGTLMEADLYRAELELEGIEGFLQDENAATLNYPSASLMFQGCSGQECEINMEEREVILKSKYASDPTPTPTP